MFPHDLNCTSSVPGQIFDSSLIRRGIQQHCTSQRIPHCFQACNLRINCGTPWACDNGRRLTIALEHCIQRVAEEGFIALDSVLQKLVDKAAICELMMKYARGIDRRDLDLVASGFTSDAHTNYDGQEQQGLEDVIRSLRTGTSRFERSTHFMGDQEIQINGDNADVETYAIDYLLYTVEGIQYQSVGGLRYQDRMARHNGRWLVQHRILHNDWRNNSRIDTSVPGNEQAPATE